MILLCCVLSTHVHGQIIDSLITQPGPTTSKDAVVWDFLPNNNICCNAEGYASSGTNGGTPTIKRFYVEFDMSSIPAGATILSATLYWYHDPNGTAFGASHTGTNNFTVRRVTQSWGINTITWNNQPTTTNTNQVSHPATTSSSQDFALNVTNLVADMMASGNHGFQLKLNTESPFRAIICGSSEVTDPTNRPKLKVIYETNCIPADTSIYSQAMCPGDLFSWQGQNFTAPLDTNITYGCDSLVTIQLTPMSADTSQINAIVCAGEYYSFNGQNYPEGTQTYLTIQCDSVVQLTVSSNIPSFQDTLEVEGCTGETLDIFGLVVGFPSVVEYQSPNCDSLIFVNAVLEANCVTHCEAFVPNSFTPNQDNINDEFKLTISAESEFISIVIFNRWGEMVFKSNSASQFWNGQWQSQDVPMGVYFYKLDYRCNDQPIEKTGFITLMR
jgi:gliding motility-associated-like protein